MLSRSRPAPWLAVTALGLALLFALWRGLALLPPVLADGTPLPIRLLLALQWVVEATFALGIAGTTVIALAYVFLAGRTPITRPPLAPVRTDPRVGILYLCCGDLDREAVDSLRRLRHDGPLEFFVHDDLPGGDPRVDALRAAAAVDGGIPLHVLRRPTRDGAKPAAINYVLEQLADRCDFLLLCDNDSIALDPDALGHLLAPMADPRTAIVQARNAPVRDASQCTINRVASLAVDVFDLFLTVGSRLAWTPFVGHNALLRTDAVRAVGGLQPGCFADDIDLTLRLQLAGHRIQYAREVAFGERHPPSYAAFRKRAYKWACGSMQVLRRWSLRTLRSRELSLAEKWGFFQFLGFFPAQALALAYTAFAYLVAPFLLSRNWFPTGATLLVGTALPLLIFLPVLAYALRHGWWRTLPSFLGTCWLCYGAADIPTTRGVLHGLGQKTRRWVPTNSVRGGCDRSMLVEAAFGVAILVVPLWQFPELLLSPLTFLIAGKFLLLPTIGELYQDGVRVEPRRVAVPGLLGRVLRVGSLLCLASMLVGQTRPAAGAALRADRVGIRGDQLLVDGKPYVVKGIHYGPWRPGTGPGRSPYPTRAQLEQDLDLVAGLHANTIFAFDVPRELLDVALARKLLVMCGFWLKWPQFGSAEFAASENAAVAAVAALKDHPAVLGWVLGNEIPSWVVTQQTPQAVQDRLRTLHARLKSADPGHPVTHANWPTTRSLDLSFFEICAFNVYALWPPEVVARGYGNFIRDVLRPLAAGRPLLITEFGANALEAGNDGQARLDRECWEGLRQAGAVGGFAFEFADEWWKNYSNPKMADAWWDRDTALDDHLRHDADPEEHYGLFDGQRRPKAASAAMAAAFGGPASDGAPPADARSGDLRPALLVIGAITVAAILFLFASRMRARHRAEAARLVPPTMPQTDPHA
jgi:cellulose synthase/poly-beta-1,6-N-acetylglucosamine synthase-like glycosyltransferase